MFLRVKCIPSILLGHMLVGIFVFLTNVNNSLLYLGSWDNPEILFQHALYFQVTDGQDPKELPRLRISHLLHSTTFLDTGAVLGVGKAASWCEVWEMGKYFLLSDQLPRHQWEPVRQTTDRIWSFTGGWQLLLRSDEKQEAEFGH